MSTVLLTKSESEEENQSIFKVFQGHEITLEIFKDVLLDKIIDESIVIELQMKKRVITGHIYEKSDVSFQKNAIVIEGESGEDMFTSILPSEISEILEGEGFLMQDHWLVKLKNGLDYFIYLAYEV